MDRLTSLLLLSSARDDQGLYPAAIVKDGITTERTPWQEGWNAACMDLSRRHLALIQWFKALPEDQQKLVAALLAQDAIFLAHDEPQEVSAGLLMNDTFGFAVADTETVPLSDLGDVATLWEEFEFDGLVAYAAIRRQALPIMPLQTPRFFKAHERACALLGPNSAP